MSDNLPPPAVLGAPAKFESWRPDQVAATLSPVDHPARFVVQSMPTGIGKSLCYVMRSLLFGCRTIILTSTKGLQSQLVADFGPIGMVDVRGQGNYDCLVVDGSCDDGPCHAGFRCSCKSDGCPYYDAVRRARGSNLVVTNYSYWMTANRFGQELGDIDELVLDEAHLAPDELSSFCAIEFEAWECEGLLGAKLPPIDLEGAREWARSQIGFVRRRLERIAARDDLPSREEIKEARALKRVTRKLESLLGASVKTGWVGEEYRGCIKFEPIWPASYAEDFLFLDVPRIVMVSATVRPKTAEVLGCDSDYRFEEYRSTFPEARRRITHIPTIHLNNRSDHSELRIWANQINHIISRRLDRKGIVHTVSYERARFLMANSRHANIMMTNHKGNTRSVVERFKKSFPPAVLVSPSLGHGWDFPYDSCEYIVVGKIPFPDTRGAVLKARCAEDKGYASYVAAIALVQQAGRAMRAADDRCEVLIVDDNARWFVPRNRRHLPSWFKVGRSATVPSPPPLLSKEIV